LKVVHQRRATAAVTLYDFEPTPDRICEDVVRGLTSRPRKLQPKYFYDERGARLFERITSLVEYYPTRTEIAILRQYGPEIAEHVGARARLVEFGSGSGDKTWILLDHLVSPAAYIPVDISRTQLVDFALRVADAYPDLHVVPICADYTGDYRLPPPEKDASRCVAFFPGSTIGNFEPPEAHRFLRRVRSLVGPEGGLLLGIDLAKDPAIIERAYNDAEGVTAEFNLNLLRRINRECGADFDLDAFRHHATFDVVQKRIEMQLVSTGDQIVHLRPDPDSDSIQELSFTTGEPIVTEYSHKYDLPRFTSTAEAAGWNVGAVWTDSDEWFALVLLG
jgi:L-histidine Nalpha-methyltransferase